MAKHKRSRGVTSREILYIGAMAGLVSALLPSVPTILRFLDDKTEITFLGMKMEYGTFLKWWVAGSVATLGLLAWKFHEEQHKYRGA